MLASEIAEELDAYEDRIKKDKLGMHSSSVLSALRHLELPLGRVLSLELARIHFLKGALYIKLALLNKNVESGRDVSYWVDAAASLERASNILGHMQKFVLPPELLLGVKTLEEQAVYEWVVAYTHLMSQHNHGDQNVPNIECLPQYSKLTAGNHIANGKPLDSKYYEE